MACVCCLDAVRTRRPISVGIGNVAGGRYATVSGGWQNGTTGKTSSVGGDERNHAVSYVGADNQQSGRPRSH